MRTFFNLIQNISLKLLIFFVFTGFTGCQSIFFFPQREIIWTPENINFNYIVHKLQINEEEYATLWEVIPKSQIRGSILYFHGNAENISTHIQSVMWLVSEGYRVYGLDYRGYGQSSSDANVENAVEDINESLRFVSNRIPQNEKLFVFSQSIGAALAMHALATDLNAKRVSFFIFDSSFSSYQAIAEDKLSEIGLFYPLSNWISNLATDCCDPANAIKSYQSSRVIIVHVEDDQVVPFKHSKLLYETLEPHPTFWHNKIGGHTSFFTKRDNRLKLLKVLESAP